MDACMPHLYDAQLSGPTDDRSDGTTHPEDTLPEMADLLDAVRKLHNVVLALRAAGDDSITIELHEQDYYSGSPTHLNREL